MTIDTHAHAAKAGAKTLRPHPDALLIRLREVMEHGELVQDGRLPPERELAEAIGISRRALRQALATLEEEGTIWRRQGHGTFVSALHPQDGGHLLDLSSRTSPAEVMEVRMEIEPILARYCALRATNADIAELRAAALRAANAATPNAFESLDATFHRLIAEAAGNRLFLAMFKSVTSVLKHADWRAVRQSTFSHSRRSEVSHQHDDVVQAIAARDPVGAEAAMRRHLGSVYAHLEQRILR